MNHALRLGFLAVLIASFSPAFCASPLDDLPADVQIQLKPYFNRPGMKRTIGALAWFGIPLTLMLVAKNKLKKHHAARTIQLKEQQSMQGGMNPLMMMMMQQQGMGGMSEAQVKGMMGQTEHEKDYKGDTASEISDLQQIIAKQDKQKVFERHIMTKGKRRLWEAVSWISSLIAIFGGANLLGTAWAFWSAPQGGDIPAAIKAAINKYRETNKGLTKRRRDLLAGLQARSKNISTLPAFCEQWLSDIRKGYNISALSAVALRDLPYEELYPAIVHTDNQAQTVNVIRKMKLYQKNRSWPRFWRAIGLWIGERAALSLHSVDPEKVAGEL